MNMPNKFLLIGLGLTIMAAPVSADVDLSSLFNQVQQQQSQLNNHDARITNNSKDIKALQENTNTAPASDPVSVPVVSDTPVAVNAAMVAPVASESTPAPTTKTITKSWYNYSFDLAGNDKAICHYEYSDGSSSSEDGEIIRKSETNPDGTTTTSVGATCKPVGTIVNF